MSKISPFLRFLAYFSISSLVSIVRAQADSVSEIFLVNFSSDRLQPILYGILIGLMVLIFGADMVLPLGIAVWVLYLFPISLAFFTWRLQIPLALAAAATAFLVLGYFLGPPGGSAATAQINRTFGTVTFWVVGITGYFFIKSKLAVRREAWFQRGHVALDKILAGEQSVEELGGKVLPFLAHYLGAQAGALFVRDKETYRRSATFAIPAENRIPEEVQPGQGLLGQALAEKRGFFLDDVPAGYLEFGSGLSLGKPRILLIEPITADGAVNSVLELGFIGKASADCPEFIRRVAESIGVAVRSARYRGQRIELLEETRRQGEELRSTNEELSTQSEELRSSNEELAEQSRALQESQARLETQHAELEESNARLEEQARLLEAQRDDLNRAQASLQAQARELSQASRYKSEFVANMSHELRTPLNSLLIMARLLADNRTGNLSADQVKYAQTIGESGNDLLALINDILDISKIEAGRIDLNPSRVHIDQIAEKLKATFDTAARAKNISFAVEIAEDAPAIIETDAQRLDQILKNFLSNAVKFTEEGKVVLRVGRATGGRPAFTVSDTGIGIPAEHQQTIFEHFRQADGTINRRYGGSGLGLSISRELARLLGGDIHVDSAVGQGSAFTLILPEAYDPALVKPRVATASGAAPLIAAPSVSPPRMSAEPLPLRKPAARKQADYVEDDRDCLTGDSRIILIVEDDVPFTRVLCDLAHELGFQCLIAGTADEGVVIARQYVPHAVLLDMSLPDHPGLSVLDRLKRDTRTRHIPVHILSVSDYSHAALALGAVGYFLKPVTREKLVEALEGIETRLTQRVRRVLIVEDDETQLASIQLLLASRDVQTEGVRTAAGCLERLQAQTFDCMVLDLTLPDATGFELLERLSDDEDLAFPPVIVYTGKDLSTDEELQLRKVSKSVIIKGAKSPERLLDEVTLFLHQVVSEMPEKQQTMLRKSLDRDAVLEGRRILVVEDDVRNVFSLTSILEPHGVEVKIARNGLEALQVLERSSEDALAPIDLVLMDVMMPEMDGLTATREIRTRPQWQDLPIITLTAKAMLDDQEQCLAAGANDYLAKPLDVDKLLSLVRVWMPR